MTGNANGLEVVCGGVEDGQKFQATKFREKIKANVSFKKQNKTLQQ